MFLLKIYKIINAKEVVAGWDPKNNKFIDGLKRILNTNVFNPTLMFA